MNRHLFHAASRRAIAAGAVLAAGVTVAACGTTGPSQGTGTSGSGSGTAAATAWGITGGSQTTFQYSQQAWDGAHPGEAISFLYYSNDAYKQKIRVAIGAGSAPTVFENWGGGQLNDYVTSGKVAALSPAVASAARQRYFPSVLNVATFDGKLYGIPVNGTQPVVVYYDKDLFAKVGAQPPKTWDDLLGLVARFKSAGITPIALGGGDQWPELMYLEYLADRIGGPSVFASIAAGKPGTWSDPAIIRAATMIQQLVKAGAFETGYDAVTYDSGASSALLYTGKAAMQVMGSWDYAAMLTADPAFIAGNKLGWTTFPAVPGGTGNPADIVGNPANFFSITTAASASAQKAAGDYLNSEVTSAGYVKNLLQAGNVPPVTGLSAQLSSQPHADWLLFQYNLVKTAPSYQLSWDQALPDSTATALLTNLGLLFTDKMTPQQFAAAMNQAGH
jgi:raffinose/stachyose/melibiose transport system substrate-binding protein